MFCTLSPVLFSSLGWILAHCRHRLASWSSPAWVLKYITAPSGFLGERGNVFVLVCRKPPKDKAVLSNWALSPVSCCFSPFASSHCPPSSPWPPAAFKSVLTGSATQPCKSLGSHLQNLSVSVLLPAWCRAHVSFIWLRGPLIPH